MKNIVIYMLLILIGLSCAPAKIELSDEEKKLEREFKIKYKNNDIEFLHSYPEVTLNLKGGKFSVLLGNTFCSYDSTSIINESILIAKQVKKILSHSDTYSEIEISSINRQKIDEHTYTYTCSVYIIITLDSFKIKEIEMYLPQCNQK